MACRTFSAHFLSSKELIEWSNFYFSSRQYFFVVEWNAMFFLMSFGYFFPICDVYCDFVSFFSLYLVHCFNMPNIKDCYSFRSIEGPKMMTDIKVWLLSFIFKSNMYISHLFLLLRKNKFRRLLIKNLNYVSKFIFWLIWILASCIIFG